MRITQVTVIGVAAVVASLVGASGVAARTPVDPTSLTPPLKPFRVCWQLGPEVQCDTSGDDSYENVPIGDFGCGQIYETGEDVSNSTRYYEDGLIVRRAVQERSRGFWSLSPYGGGPIVEWQRDFSLDEHFATPGDIESAIRIVKGSTVRVPALGADLHASGWSIEDTDDRRGHFADGDANLALLCPLLVG